MAKPEIPDNINSSDISPVASGLIDNRLIQILLTEVYLYDIHIDPIPDYIRFGGSAIVVSNYPGVMESIRAGMKVGLKVPNGLERWRFIARKEAIDNASPMMRILGLPKFMLPARKKGDKSDEHELDSETLKLIYTFMTKPGALLWLTATGRFYPDDLNPELARAGPARFSVKTNHPILPMAYHHENIGSDDKPNLRVYRVSFGDLISPPFTNRASKFWADHIRKKKYLDHTKKVIGAIQELLQT